MLKKWLFNGKLECLAKTDFYTLAFGKMSLQWSNLVGPGLAHEYETRTGLKKESTSDKQSSLSHKYLNYTRESFIV